MRRVEVEELRSPSVFMRRVEVEEHGNKLLDKRQNLRESSIS